MEEQQSLFEFNVDKNTGNEFIELSRWSKLFAIILISLVGIAILTIGLVWNQFATTFTEESGASSSVLAVSLTIMGLVILCIGGIMMFFLLRGANRIRKGITTRDQFMFSSGLGDIKTYFAFLGVFSILSLLSSLITLL